MRRHDRILDHLRTVFPIRRGREPDTRIGEGLEESVRLVYPAVHGAFRRPALPWIPLSLANPGAGVDGTYSPTAGEVWRILQFQGLLTTSAVAANRQAGFRWGPLALQCRVAAGRMQPASFSVTYVFGVGLGYTEADLDVLTAPIPEETWVLPEWIFGQMTTNIQAGDTWTAVSVRYEAHNALRDAEI